MRKRLKIFLACSLLASSSWAISKTSPASPVSVLRFEAFTDGFKNAYSTYSVQMDTWDVVADSYTWVPSNQVVTGWVTDTSTIPWTVKEASWSISDYTALISEQARRQVFDSILDKDEELWLVWPDTNPPLGWSGWCHQGSTWVPCP